jgi:negative regulator of genetic competence, sporulation and motility
MEIFKDLKDLSSSKHINIAIVIDNLYQYVGNRLMKVTDEQQNPSGYKAEYNTIDMMIMAI